MLWWLLGGVACKPRARAAPRLIKRRATSTTRQTKWIPQTIASWYPFESGQTMAALLGETIEPSGADTFPWRGSVTTTRYARAVNGPCERSWLAPWQCPRCGNWNPIGMPCRCNSGRLGRSSEAGGERLYVGERVYEAPNGSRAPGSVGGRDRCAIGETHGRGGPATQPVGIQEVFLSYFRKSGSEFVSV